jgi:pimeloyl-ACP methyl ester carboxylesterase
MSSFLWSGDTSSRRRLALLQEGEGPPVLWLGGFRSNMRATKASFLATLARREGFCLTRFDYSGHGESEGKFLDGTMSQWLEDALAVLQTLPAPALLVGSSMGGWIALLLALRLRETPLSVKGLVLIAPAVDFTQDLIWDRLPESLRNKIHEEGLCLLDNPYGSDLTSITRTLIEDGRQHRLFGASIRPACPVHILQGGKDPDVPLSHTLKLITHLEACPVTLTVIPDGDHRLSREEDLAALGRAVCHFR